MVQHTAILTMADQQKVVYDLLNGSIFNDLKLSLMLIISETVRPQTLCH